MTDDVETMYFVRHRGKIVGPYSVPRLKQLHARGQFSRFHEVSIDKLNWQSASAIAEVFSRQRNPPHQERTPLEADFPIEPEIPPGGLGNPPENSSRKTQWYYNAGGEQHGPVSLVALREMIASGGLLPNDQVWRDGMPDWDFIQNVPDLGAALPRAPSMAYAPPYGYGAPGLPPADKRTSGLAVASITLGILGLFIGLCSVFAIIFGSAALINIGQSHGTVTGKGMAISGLITGVIGAVFWAVWLLWFLDLIVL